jgi:acetate kinase
MQTSPAGTLRVLVFNTGSSSLKCGLYEVGQNGARTLLEAEAEAIGKPGRLWLADGSGNELVVKEADFADADAAMSEIDALIEEHAGARPQAVGHRLVHGGARLLQHVLIDAAVLAELRGAAAFAPLHVPAALKIVDISLRMYPGLPQAACFDTAFHAGLPEESRVLPLPRELLADGVRRYGFHGLSCESILAQLDPVPPRLIIAHLGSGASLTAVRDGKSVDTSMGLTPDGGIVMGTRSGDLDPGVLAWLARSRKLSPDQIEDMVTRRSGLAGISGLTGDMRELRAAAGSNAAAALAIRIFALSVAKQVAAQTVSLGGLDALVFTGGIGEHDAQSRAEICAHLGWAGLCLDEQRNLAHSATISAATSGPTVQVIATAEGATIARHVFRLTRST